MRRLYKIIIVGIIALIMLSCFANSEEKQKNVKILVFGNSILMHPIAENIGWTGTWGMAASSEDTDYFHVMQRELQSINPDVNFSFVKKSGTNLEKMVKETTTDTYFAQLMATVGSVVTKEKPDIVVLQIGENMPSVSKEAYAHAYKTIGEYIVEKLPECTVLYCTLASFGTDAKNEGVRLASKETGYPLCELSQYDKPMYKATGLFENAGVAAHPGDKGMEVIGKELAKSITEIINIPVEEKPVQPNKITVKIDDITVDFSNYGVEPQIINNRTMVPLRSIFESLKAYVIWDDSTKTVTSVRKDILVEFTIGAQEMKINDVAIALDTPAVIVDSRTLVPVRAVSEAFGCQVDWDDATKTVSIKSPDNILSIEIPVVKEQSKESISTKVVYALKFNNPDDWNKHGVLNSQIGDVFKGTAENDDPNLDLKNDVGIEIEQVKQIKLKANIQSGTDIQIFFDTQESRGFSESKCFTFSSGSAENGEYIVNTSTCSGWKNGILGKIRIDPVSTKGFSFELFSIEFLG